MSMPADIGRKIRNAWSVATDWLLMVMGTLLVLIALWRIDVVVARYVVIAGGMILAAMGGWYRRQRLKKEKASAR